ncbi:DUF1269 domain-containing protein [Microvirga aerophila]|uniref:DUF1269 domain-containing protein n=1 Tax=Microvirga aerophila TaxID=670291 RepID=A0A512BP81_9HYPH|nr:DUF1269 domain-containing protein [Microvirga aerophila]GEO13735.1 hypothetical protein MAE02_14310 [Microvirga aerophila]
MGQFVAVIFPDPAQASEGARALSALHAEGGIAPSGMAVVVKEPSGQWLVTEKTADGALATVVTALIGGIAGAAGGPVGAAIGAAGGALVGRGADLIHRQAATAFVDRVSRQLPIGQAALVTEITEDGILAFTERMQAMGGMVVHV